MFIEFFILGLDTLLFILMTNFSFEVNLENNFKNLDVMLDLIQLCILINFDLASLHIVLERKRPFFYSQALCASKDVLRYFFSIVHY